MTNHGDRVQQIDVTGYSQDDRGLLRVLELGYYLTALPEINCWWVIDSSRGDD